LTGRDLRFLTREKVMRVTTTGRDGRPWAVPVCHVVADGAVYFGSDRRGLKIRNIARTRKAGLVADRYRNSWRGLRGVALTGRAAVLTRGPEFDRAVRLLYRKYPQYERVAALEPGESVVVRVTPVRVISWQFEG
jgi:nitroimidazol reductase NimA-like FMN-containing flavoprotein (pyridoxamine 5'-phosphate oxidase superfamily)